MKPYSQDLRERVIAALEAGDETQAEIAERFCLCKSTVEKWWYRWQATGSCAALPLGHGPVRTLEAYETFLRAEVQQQPDVTLAELCERMAASHTVSASLSMMGRTVQLLNLPRKKKSLHDSQRDTPRVTGLRRDFVAHVKTKLSDLLSHLKFIDEIGLNLGLTRLYGRAAPGERVTEGTPDYSGPHYTTIAAIGLRGVEAPWIFEGAMTTLAFETYVEAELAPILRRGDIVLADNLSAHKSAESQRLIEARGARLEFLPPYSSDFNPIELCWSKVKAALRTAKARTFEALLDALASALRSVSPADAKAWFAHCGYAVS
jgi:transposase